MNELKLYDIKPLVDVPDISVFAFIALLGMGGVLLLLLLYMLFIFIKQRKKNERKEYFEILENLNLEETKHAAYSITKYGRLLAQSDREKKFFYLLLETLDEYKYKKEVKPFSQNTLIKYENFMEEIDV